MFNPTESMIQSSILLNTWLKSIMTMDSWVEKRKALIDWKSAPGALVCHPREEHLLPLFVIVGTTVDLKNSVCKIIYDTSNQTSDEKDDQYHISGYIFV
jgi:hypothetical protein